MFEVKYNSETRMYEVLAYGRVREYESAHDAEDFCRLENDSLFEDPAYLIDVDD